MAYEAGLVNDGIPDFVKEAEEADGRRRCRSDRYHSGTSAFRTFRLRKSNFYAASEHSYSVQTMYV